MWRRWGLLLPLGALSVCAALSACSSSQPPGAAASAAGSGGVEQANTANAAGGLRAAGGSGGSVASVGGSGGSVASVGGSATSADKADGGSAPVGGASAGPAEPVPALALPGASDFTSFTLHEYAYITPGPSGTCEREDPSDSRTPYDSKFTFDRGSHVLSWDTCNSISKMLEQGSITLSAAEVQSLFEQLALVVPTQQKDGDPCRADGPYAEMDVEVGASTTRYRASSGWCGAPPSDQNPVDGLTYFLSWVAKTLAHLP